MGMTFKKDILIAAVIAIAVHAGVSLIVVHERSISHFQENKVNRNLEISFVSTYKEVKKAQPVVKKKKKMVVIKKRTVKRSDTPVRKKVQQVEKKATYVKPAETMKLEETAPEPVAQEAREVENKRGGESKKEVASDKAEETVQIVEEKPLEKEPAKEVKTLPAVPRYSENPPPPYPSIARRRGYEGVVMFSVEVLADGSVGELRIKETSGHSMLDRAAVKAVKKWKFKPAFREDVPVSMWVEVPIRFVIK